MKQEGFRFLDEHFEPDADAHRSAFLGVDELVAQVGLVDDGADRVRFAEEREEEGLRAEVGDGEKEAGLFDLAHDFAEKRVDEHGALGEHAPELKHLANGEDDGDGDEGADDADQDGNE